MDRWIARTALVATLSLAAAPVVAAARPVRSMLELRREGVVPQGWDLSCGAAALSTILTHQHGDPVPEPEIVKALLAGADPEKIRARGGFSLLDLKRYATARGYGAVGYRDLGLAGLAAVGTAIVPTLDEAGPHFMVFRGVVRGRVLLADPAYGNRTISSERFLAMWSPRIAFVVRPPGSAAPPPPEGATLVSDRVLRGAVRSGR